MSSRCFRRRAAVAVLVAAALLLPAAVAAPRAVAAQLPPRVAVATGRPAAEARPLAIRGARIVDGTGRPAFEGTLVVQGERIVAVGPDVGVPEGARVVEAEGRTLLPGLFDLHLHLRAAASSRLPADFARNLAATLYCGVTSVAELGSDPESFAPMRRLLREGALAGPRVSFAARLAVPGGHGAEAGRSGLHTRLVVTPEDARAAVGERAGYGPELLKVFSDGWRYGTEPDLASMRADTLAALVEEAHSRGLRVLTHTVSLARAREAAAAGVDVLGHGIGDGSVDDDLAAALAGRAYVSTLAVYEPAGRRPAPAALLLETLDPEARARALQPPRAPSPAVAAARAARFGHLLANVARLRAAGVALGVGTDAGMPSAPFGFAVHRELALLVEAGLSPLEALRAATGESARILGVSGERGTLEPGRLADLLLVEGRPDVEIADSQRISRVFLGGAEVDRAALRARVASAEPVALAAAAPIERLDAFEQPSQRSAGGALWLESTEPGASPTRVLVTRPLRAPGNHALALAASMSRSERSFARLTLPLTPGGLLPLDVRPWRGVRFEARGEGRYRLLVTRRAARPGPFAAEFEAGPRWRGLRVAFSSLAGVAERPLSFDALTEIAFEATRGPGETAWLELDEVGFYR
jgi:imidazolonepropionase-like amidohydrolase